MRQWLTVTALLAVIATTMAACRRHETAFEPGHTGINLTIRYDPSLALSALALSGEDGAEAAFAPGTLPDPPRPLTSGRESAVLLLPDADAGRTLSVRVDGRAGSAVLASDQQSVTVQ